MENFIDNPDNDDFLKKEMERAYNRMYKISDYKEPSNDYDFER